MHDLPPKAFVMPTVVTALMGYHAEELVLLPVQETAHF